MADFRDTVAADKMVAIFDLAKELHDADRDDDGAMLIMKIAQEWWALQVRAEIGSLVSG